MEKSSLSTVFTTIILAGALIAGAAKLAPWVILVIAVLAAVANIVDPRARAIRAAQGKTLAKALPMLVFNQIIWTNLAFLVGFGVAWLIGGPVVALPVWLPVAVSAVGAAGAVAVSLKG